MNPEIEQVFLAVADMDRDARLAYYDSHGLRDDIRREVDSLLTFDRDAAQFLAQGLLSSMHRKLHEDDVAARYGPYRIVKPLGSGGIADRIEPLDREVVDQPQHLVGQEGVSGGGLRAAGRRLRQPPRNLGAAPVETVTAAEAEAYRTYVDEYSRYWRQYFDPIALRLDDAPAGELELSTFILPLLDSELYDRVREVLAVRETGPALRVPVVTPDPVLRLSLNLTEEAWVKVAGLSSDLLLGYAGISPAIFSAR